MLTQKLRFSVHWFSRPLIFVPSPKTRIGTKVARIQWIHVEPSRNIWLVRFLICCDFQRTYGYRLLIERALRGTEVWDDSCTNRGNGHKNSSKIFMPLFWSDWSWSYNLRIGYLKFIKYFCNALRFSSFFSYLFFYWIGLNLAVKYDSWINHTYLNTRAVKALIVSNAMEHIFFELRITFASWKSIRARVWIAPKIVSCVVILCWLFSGLFLFSWFLFLHVGFDETRSILMVSFSNCCRGSNYYQVVGYSNQRNFLNAWC